MACYDLIKGDRLIQSNPDAGKMIAMRREPCIEPMTTPYPNPKCGARCRSIPYGSMVIVDEIHTDDDGICWFSTETQCLHGYFYAGWLPVIGLPSWTNWGRNMFKQVSRSHTTYERTNAYVKSRDILDTYVMPNVPSKKGRITAGCEYVVLEMLMADDVIHLNLAELEHDAQKCHDIGWITWNESNIDVMPSECYFPFHPPMKRTTMHDVGTIDLPELLSTLEFDHLPQKYIHNPYGDSIETIAISV
jgi:hypothetical protein